MTLRVSSLGIVFSIFLLAAARLGAVDLTTGPVWLAPVADSVQWFSGGGALKAGVGADIPGSPFFWNADFETAWIEAIPARGVLLASVVPEAGVRWVPAPGIATTLTLGAGWGVGSRTDLVLGTNFPVLLAAAAAEFDLNPALKFRIGAGYQTYLGLWQGIPVSASFEIPWEAP